MQLSVLVGSTNLDHLALIEPLEIRRDSSEAISTATVPFKVVQAESARYGISRYGQARYAFGVRQWQEITIQDQSANKHFGGYIVDVKRQPSDNSKFSYVCTCSDYGIKLTRTFVNTTYTNESDEDIILDAFSSQTDVLIDSANISLLATDLGVFEAKDISLRDLLDRVCELTGGSWHVDPDRYLHYYSAGNTDAPYALSDQPDNVTSVPYTLNEVKEESASLANRITVLAGFDSDGDEIVETAQNLESQGRFGVFSATIVDRSVDDISTAALMANAELSVRAFPRVSGTAITRTDGFTVGQTVAIKSTLYGINWSYLIQAVTIRQLLPNLTEYQIRFGDKVPTEFAILKRLLNKPKQQTATVVGRPPANSITVDNFASTIEPVRIVNSLPALPDAAYSDNAVVLLTTDRKLYRRTGNTWTAAVPTVDLTGEIEELQIAAGAVTEAKIAAAAVTNTKIADDSISSPKIVAGAILAGKIAAGAVETDKLAAQAVVAGKIATGAVEADKIAANAVTAGKIDADAVTAGTIAAGAIRASDAAFEVGAIQTADIGNAQITTAKIGDAQITNAKIVTLSASKLTAGTIDASVITVTNLSASNITTGSMSGTRLSDGTVSDIKISSGLSAAKITTGTMAADRVGAGTITAAVSMTSPSLTITSGGTVVNIDGTNYIRLTTSGTSTIVAMEPGGLSVRSSGGNPRSDIGKGSMTLISSGGAAGIYGPTSVILNGTQVLSTQGASIGDPVGGANIDTQCRTAVVSILQRLRNHGIIA
jgi:hypothetical protein